MTEPAPFHDTRPRHAVRSDAPLIEQWNAIADAARVVAMLARRAPPLADADTQLCIAQLERSGMPHNTCTALAIGELVATMRAGLDALLAAHGTSANPRPAAERLWQEYERGRMAVLREISAVDAH